jgi:hypothetical protein
MNSPTRGDALGPRPERPRRADVHVAAILVSALIVNGCHTMTRVGLPDAASPAPNAMAAAGLSGGDEVRVTLRTGEKVSFALSEVRAEGLVASDGRYVAYSEMAELKKQTFSSARTTWLIIGVAGGTAFFLVVLAVGMAYASGF